MFGPLCIHTNKFSALNASSNVEKETAVRRVEPKTTPIFVQSVTNYTSMVTNIKTVINHNKYVCKTLANKLVRINTYFVEAYCKLVNHFRQNQKEFYTYFRYREARKGLPMKWSSNHNHRTHFFFQYTFNDHVAGRQARFSCMFRSIKFLTARDRSRTGNTARELPRSSERGGYLCRVPSICLAADKRYIY